MNLLIPFRSEIIKTRRTASFYLTVFAGAFNPFMSLLDTLIGEGIAPDDRDQYLTKLFVDKFEMTGILVFPFFIMLATTLLAQVEYRNNTWKQILTAPQSRGSVFLAKYANVHRLILTFLIINQLFVLLEAVILHFKEPSMNLFGQPLSGIQVVTNILNSYVALLGMLSIQFWLGLRFRNFIVPLAAGIGLWFFGTLLLMNYESPWAAYFPYSYHVYSAFPKFQSQLDTVRWMSVVYALLFGVIGYIDFRNRRMTA